MAYIIRSHRTILATKERIHTRGGSAASYHLSHLGDLTQPRALTRYSQSELLIVKEKGRLQPLQCRSAVKSVAICP